MFEIRDWLYIGKYAHTRDADLLSSMGITAMLQLAEHAPQKGIETRYLYLDDGEPIPDGHIQKGVQFIRQQHAEGKRVLVACGAGISRSAIFTIAALMEEEDRDLLEAYREVYTVYRNAEPHPVLAMSLAAHHGQEWELIDAYDKLHQVRKEVQSISPDN